jgi:CBS domain-containing protein
MQAIVPLTEMEPDMKAKDVMTSPVISVEPGASIWEAVRIMLQRRSRAGRSTHDGCSITTRVRPTTTRLDTDSARTPSRLANMFQSMDTRGDPTLSR